MACRRALVFSLVFGLLGAAEQQADALERPRLVVVTVVDQLGSEPFTRYASQFSGGFGRLIRRGAWYTNGLHAQASTATGPGHATIATGAWPSVHGIIANRWYDRSGGLEHCVGAPGGGQNPKKLMAPGLGDALKLASLGHSKTVGLALKDRAAILSTGAKPDVVVFYEPTLGRFISPDYSKKKPSWVEEINLAHGPTQAANLPWDRFSPTIDYAQIAGPDDVPFETDAFGFGRTFPKTRSQTIDPRDPNWLNSYRAHPDSLDAVFDLASKAIEMEELGRDAAPDLLFIGISNTDIAGHLYGAESQEYFDLLLRVDARLGALMDSVEKTLGRDSTLWVVTGDHGVAPIPEVAERYGLAARRVDQARLSKLIDQALEKAHSKARTKMIYGPMIFLSRESRPTVEHRRAAAEALRSDPDVAEVFADEDLAQMSEAFRPYYERARYATRTPDLWVRFQPGVVLDNKPHGSGFGSRHGSAYTFDTHVPILIAGPRIWAGIDSRPREITQIAPCIATVLAINPPAAALDEPLPACTH